MKRKNQPHRVRERRIGALARLEKKKQKTERDIKQIEILKGKIANEAHV